MHKEKQPSDILWDYKLVNVREKSEKLFKIKSCKFKRKNLEKQIVFLKLQSCTSGSYSKKYNSRVSEIKIVIFFPLTIL